MTFLEEIRRLASALTTPLCLAFDSIRLAKMYIFFSEMFYHDFDFP